MSWASYSRRSPACSRGPTTSPSSPAAAESAQEAPRPRWKIVVPGRHRNARRDIHETVRTRGRSSRVRRSDAPAARPTLRRPQLGRGSGPSHRARWSGNRGGSRSISCGSESVCGRRGPSSPGDWSRRGCSELGNPLGGTIRPRYPRPRRPRSDAIDGGGSVRERFSAQWVRGSDARARSRDRKSETQLPAQWCTAKAWRARRVRAPGRSRAPPATSCLSRG